jgi:hypothetical protein
VHRFELLSEGGACFHPCGNEAILNSEVWDIRTNKLLRSVPLLDGTELVFNGDGSVLFASLRRGAWLCLVLVCRVAEGLCSRVAFWKPLTREVRV